MMQNAPRVKIKSRIVVAKSTFNKKETFHSKLGLNLRKKPVQCCIWSTALCGAETLTVRTVIRKFGRFLNVVLQNDGDFQLDGSRCEK